MLNALAIQQQFANRFPRRFVVDERTHAKSDIVMLFESVPAGNLQCNSSNLSMVNDIVGNYRNSKASGKVSLGST